MNIERTSNPNRVNFHVNYVDSGSLSSNEGQNIEADVLGVRVYKDNFWTKVRCFFGFASPMQVGAEKIYINRRSLFYHLVEGWCRTHDRTDRIQNKKQIKDMAKNIEKDIKNSSFNKDLIVDIFKRCNQAPYITSEMFMEQPPSVWD